MMEKQHELMPFREVINHLLLACNEGSTGAFYVATDKRHWGEFLLDHGSIVGVRFRANRGIKALQLMRRSVEKAKYSFNPDGFAPFMVRRDSEVLPSTEKIFQFLGSHVELPLGVSAERRMRPQSVGEQDTSRSHVRHIGRAGQSAVSRKVAALGSEAPIVARTILVVEDSVISRRVIHNTLSVLGHKLIEAGDGYEALAQLSNERPDLVLLDLTMPGMDGYQVLSLMKQKPEFKNIPVIILSARDSLMDKLKGRLSGSDEYLTKPFSSVELEDKVKKYLK